MLAGGGNIGFFQVQIKFFLGNGVFFLLQQAFFLVQTLAGEGKMLAGLLKNN